MSLALHRYSSLANSSPYSSEDELVSMSAEEEVSPAPAADIAPTPRRWRNLAAFWLLGLCNNYAYVIMLSAAHDILGDGFNSSLEEDSGRDCNPTSTGAILLADVLPSLLAKMVNPAVNAHTHVRVAVTMALSAVSFVLVATSVNQAMAYAGVVCASLGSGIGEVTFLAYTAHFHSDVVSTWSSGTGFSGVVGSFSYSALISAGLSPRNTLLVMLVCPVLMALTYGGLLRHPQPADDDVIMAAAEEPLQASEKKALLRHLPIFMVPLGLVYLAEYFINQGLVELIWFKDIWLSHADQYRWLQVVYQVGVFVSRSSVNLVNIRRIWILTLLQVINATFFFFEAYYLFVPSWWLIVALVAWEGLLGGAAYVNTFNNVYHQFPGREREFLMGTVSLADSMGIAIAGGISLPVHDALCKLPGPVR